MMRALLWSSAVSGCLAILLLAPAAAGAQDSRSIPIRVAYISWTVDDDHDDNDRTDSGRRMVNDVGKSLEQRWREVGGATAPLRFDVVQGNYYQVMAWMRSGEIDAAVVSSFMAYLLRRDGTAVPLVELCTPLTCEPIPGKSHLNVMRPGVRPGHLPAIRSIGLAGDRPNPMGDFNDYLSALWHSAAASSPDDGAKLSSYDVLMVTHLSASGFVAPTIYADRWLEQQPPSQNHTERTARFWQAYFERSRFLMQHECKPPSADVIRLCFSDTRALRRAETRKVDEAWKEYDLPETPGKEKEPPLVLPNDLLMVRPAVLTRLGSDMAPVRAGEWLLRQGRPVETGGFLPLDERRTNFVGMHPVAYGVHDNFARTISPVFGRGSTRVTELRGIMSRWFEEGRFDFTPGEVIDLLRMDQRTSTRGELSLVLPGGGVKSLYQAVLLDELYKSGSLQNDGHVKARERAGRPVEARAAEPLVVRNIIGTSGGALLGLLTALMRDPSHGLTEDVGRTAASPVFPPIDLLRAVSILVLLAMFVLVLRMASTNIPKPARLEATYARVLLPALCAVPTVAILRFTPVGIGETSGLVAGVLVAALVCLHFIFTCTAPVRPGEAREPASQLTIYALLLGAVGVSCQVLAIWGALIYDVDESVFTAAAGLSAFLAMTGGLAFTLTVICLLVDRRFGLQLVAKREYVLAIAMLTAYVTGCYAIIAAFTYFERATLLEITFDFWNMLLVVGALGAIISIGLSIFAIKRVRRRQADGEGVGGLGRFVLMIGDAQALLLAHRAQSFLPASGTVLLLMAAVAFGWWVRTMAPAIYGSQHAAASFDSNVQRFVAEGNDRLTANLIVTATLVATATCERDLDPERFLAGDLYMCFPSPEQSCGRQTGQRWIPFDPRRVDIASMVDAAFASGSPFPIFPAKRVVLPSGCALDLIDGGYAHNVPLEAAYLGGTRQVLVVNSSPDTPSARAGSAAASRRREMTVGRLLSYGGKLLPFLFERAQQIDRDIANHMMVASLTPNGDGRDFPFLVDFRSTTRKALVDWARHDLATNRRIGRIERWGPPSVLPPLVESELRP